MTLTEISDIANAAIAEEFELELEDMLPTSNLYEDLGLDSLDAVDLVLVLENAFSVKLRNMPEIKEVRTLEDVYTLIDSLQDAQ